MRTHRWCVVVLLVAGSLHVMPAAACEDDADCGGEVATLDNRAVEARVFDWSSVASGTEQSTPSCTYEHVAYDALTPPYVDLVVRDLIASDARFYRVTCDGGATWKYGWWRPSKPATDVGAFHDVLQEAIGRLAPDAPQLRLSPPADRRHLTGMPTWLAVTPASWRTWEMTVEAGMARAEVTLTPIVVEWATGDGHQQTCDGPGARYQGGIPEEGACVHTFLETPADATGDHGATTFTVSARIRYRVEYAVTTPFSTRGATLGSIVGPRTSRPVQVQEYVALRTPWPS
ncbi:MAG: hypothetical protein WD377_08390 [Nitriliruptoraceae bacterium]